MKVWALIITLSTLLCSCNSNDDYYDKVIAKHNDTDFSALKDRFVYYRSAGNQRNYSIYHVSKYHYICSPYAVEWDDRGSKLIHINNKMVYTTCDTDYLSKDEIEIPLKRYLELHLYVVGVDSEDNVYINPMEQLVPTMLRKAPNSTPKDLDKFELYKGNWYIRK